MEAIGTEPNIIYQVKTPPKHLLQHIENVTQLFIHALDSDE